MQLEVSREKLTRGNDLQSREDDAEGSVEHSIRSGSEVSVERKGDSEDDGDNSPLPFNGIRSTIQHDGGCHGHYGYQSTHDLYVD